MVASMALYASVKLQKSSQSNSGFWNATLSKNTGYKEDDLKSMAGDLIKYVRSMEKSSLQTMCKKYNLPKFMEVAKML